MTTGGTVAKTWVLFAIFTAGALFGWQQTATPATGGGEHFPNWLLPAVLAGFVCAIVPAFLPKTAALFGPIYAAAQGAVVGAVSYSAELEYPGIAVQTVGVTVAVFATMLFLYTTQIVTVTVRFRNIVVCATCGIAVFYLVALIARLFTGSTPLLNSVSPLGIGISALFAGIAALNLLLDFETIERGTTHGAPKHMEWYAALGLTITIVWLYMEVLRLISKLRN